VDDPSCVITEDVPSCVITEDDPSCVITVGVPGSSISEDVPLVLVMEKEIFTTDTRMYIKLSLKLAQWF
jgi:hypothetical protein